MLTSEYGQTEWRVPRLPTVLLTTGGTSITEEDVEGGKGCHVGMRLSKTFVRLRAMKEFVIAQPTCSLRRWRERTRRLTS